jgi:hypothetical protein
MTSNENLIIIPNAGSIDDDQLSNYHDISEINYYQRGYELLSLLQEIGAVTFDRENKLTLSNFYVNGRENKKTVSRLLGYIAEGIIVRECNNDPSANMKWANYARRMCKLRSDDNYLDSISYEEIYPEDPNNYVAIGTGFSSTRYGKHSWAYSPTHCRDICWIHEDNSSQLLTVDDLHVVNQRFAGLQVKVSSSSLARYVTNYFREKTYHELYPVVYFDLGDDFYDTRDRIYNLGSYEVKPQTIFSDDVNFQGYSMLSRDEVLEMMLVRGKDIAPEIHSELIWHKYTLEKVVNEDISLDELMDDDVLTAIIIEYISKSIEPQSPIILMSK